MKTLGMKNSPILIIGKNGKTGSRVNQRLQALGYDTRAVSRSTTPSFDWEDSATWAAAIKGARSAYVTYQPDLAVPNAEPAIKEFVRVARESRENTSGERYLMEYSQVQLVLSKFQ